MSPPAIAASGSRSAAQADPFIRSVGLVALMLVVQRSIGFARSFYVCDVLSPTEVGVWDLSFSFLITLAPLAVLGIPGSFGRYVASFESRGGVGRFQIQTMIACLALSILAGLAIAGCATPISRWVFGAADRSGLIRLIAVGLPILVMFNYACCWFSGRRMNRRVFRIQFVQCLAFAFLCVSLIPWLGATGQSVVVAYLASCLFGLVLAGAYFFTAWIAPNRDEPDSQSPTVASDTIWKKILPFAFWVWTSNALINLFAVCDRLLIVNRISQSETQIQALVGQYHSARILPLILLTVGAMAGSMVTPYLSKDWEANRRSEADRRLNSMIKSIGLLCLIGSIGVIVGAPMLFRGLWQDKFALGQSLLPWTLSYCSLGAMTLVAQKYFWCIERTWLSSIALAAGIGINVAVGVALAPSFGIKGIVLATWFSYAFVLLLVLGLAIRSGFRLDRGVWWVVAAILSGGMGPMVSVASLGGLLALAVTTDQLFSDGEKAEVIQRISSISRFWRRRSS